MPDARKPVDQLLDLVVYAPLGLLLNLDEVVPQLVEKGRQQVVAARMFGRFAVEQGGAEAKKRTAGLQERAAGLVGQFGGLGGAGHEADPPMAAAPVATPAPAPAAPAEEIIPVTIERDDTEGAAVGPAEDELAVPGYDSLSASQVVPRLAGLSGAELEAVRRYEEAHRGRKTILAKIDQLQR
ncbi:MAG: hypothetical protein H0V33_03800 [Acidimicrobiia bacterium]|nr:hypothetical protein [Acidimicrobiia bacterium]